MANVLLLAIVAWEQGYCYSCTAFSRLNFLFKQKTIHTHESHTGCVGEDLLVLAVSGSLCSLVVNSMTRCVESFLTFFRSCLHNCNYLCGCKSTSCCPRSQHHPPPHLPWSSVDNQTCPSEEQCAIVRTEIEAGTRSLLQFQYCIVGNFRGKTSQISEKYDYRGESFY